MYVSDEAKRNASFARIRLGQIKESSRETSEARHRNTRRLVGRSVFALAGYKSQAI